MNYISLEGCKRFVFPYIYEQLTNNEPTAQYEQESTGIAELKKVFELVQNDLFYPTLPHKAAYLLCSIAGSQYFSNGNKRLGVITLLFFLIMNDAEVLALDSEGYEKLLRNYFPSLIWEHNLVIGDNLPIFLYNLTILIGDRKQWGQGIEFDAVKGKVTELFSVLCRQS